MTPVRPATRMPAPKTSVSRIRTKTCFVQRRASRNPHGNEAKATTTANAPKKSSIPRYFGAACTRAATFSRSAFRAMKPVASFWL